MSRISLASHPFLLGFDQLDKLVERATRTGSDGYPPYNIEQHGEHAYRIVVAVAGFAEEDLSVTVEDGQLVIRGRARGEAEDGAYLHKGIATRAFQRSFVLAEGLDVTGAALARGLLSVDLARRVAEPEIQTIKIRRETA